MRARIISTIVLISLLATALVTSPAGAANAETTRTVTNLLDSGPGSLRSTIAASLDGDTITFAVTGTIFLKKQLSVSRSITLQGPGPSKLIISGNGVTRIFLISGGPTVTMTGLTVTDGYVTSSSGGAYGGGIDNLATLTLVDVVVSGNKAYATGTSGAYGGGIFSQGTLTIKNSTISSNHVAGLSHQNNPAFGGGISHYAGTLTISHSIIKNNVSTSEAGGIQVYFGAKLSMTNSSMSGNVAQYGAGGAIAVFSDPCGDCSTLSLNHVSIDNNTAVDGGSGIWVQHSATVTITNSSITNNKSTSTLNSYGGGLEIGTYTSATLTNVTVSGNVLGPIGQGGGIDEDGALGPVALNLNNVTISNNSAATGGGLESSGAATANLHNTLIANNTATTGPDCNASSSLNSLDYNLIGDASGCAISGTTTHNITGLKARLGPLALNGSNTLSQALMTGSPAMDAADNTTCATVDQRGKTRPQDGDGNSIATCDIGAFEDTPASPVNVTYDSVAADDGFVIESAQGSGLGGSVNAGAGMINIGDNQANKQDRGILSFGTDALPDNAVILHATLKLMRMSVTGSPAGLGTLIADVSSPFFGTTLALEKGDFQAAASGSGAVAFGAPSGSTYSAPVNWFALPYIGLTTPTQFRLRFFTPTNGNLAADLISIFSGEDPTVANQPALVIQYYIP